MLRAFSRSPARVGRHLGATQCRQLHISSTLFSEREEIHNGEEQQPDGSTQSKLKTPTEVMVLPLFKRPLFPGIVAPIVVPNEPFSATLQAIRDKMPVNVGVFLAKKNAGKSHFNKLEHIHPIGLLAQVMRVFPHKQGMSQVVLVGLHRIKASNTVQSPKGSENPFMVEVSALADEPYDPADPFVKACTLEIVATVKSLLKLNPMFKEQYSTIVEQVDLSLPGDLCDCVAGLSTTDTPIAQGVLETLNIKDRMKRALELLKKEVEYGHIQAKIHQSMDGSMNKNHRRFVLLDQLKAIKKELGMEHDEKDTLITKFQKRIAERDIPENTMTTINEEMNKLASVEPSSSEFNVTRNYLDWLTVLPWGTSTKEVYNLRNAEKILDEDHFGLDDVKHRVLELIAVGALRGSVKGKILCLVGPPGVGKTSIAKSIARSLGREFYRFSVGGMSDVAEIKGHRRTYVGALPGKPIQALKVTKTSNPVLLIDEIDKMGRGVNGDPGSSLLEVLFIVTANTLSTVPRPLLDRMEVIELSGYVTEEKIAIAKTYLIPRALEDCGLKGSDATISDDAIRSLIVGYCREAGVRNLQQHLEKILRKVTYKIAAAEAEKVDVTAENLSEFIGKPIFTSDRYHDVTPPGVVMGLAYSQMGGSAMYIETIKTPASPGGTKFRTTGSMGDVMTESTNIAFTFAQSFLSQFQPENTFFRDFNLHMHVPQGATPKEGPSAGCAMVTSLMSLATNTNVPHNIAMTGEITLTGKVLRIGGVKEKTMAAKRAGAAVILFPKENEADFEELPDYITKGIEVHFVSDFSDVMSIALPDALKSQESPKEGAHTNP